MSNPIHKHDNYWWFWNEIQTERIGPFPTEHVAEREMTRYALAYLEGQEELTVWVTEGELDDIRIAANRSSMRIGQWCKHTLIQQSVKGKEPEFFSGDNLY
jgi:hypothetical protein